MRHQIKQSAVAFAAVASVLLGACSAGSTSNQNTGQEGGSGDKGSGASQASNEALAVGLVAEPANLDFTKTDGAAIPQALLDNVYEGLVKLDHVVVFVPLLAMSFRMSDDSEI